MTVCMLFKVFNAHPVKPPNYGKNTLDPGYVGCGHQYLGTNSLMLSGNQLEITRNDTIDCSRNIYVKKPAIIREAGHKMFEDKTVAEKEVRYTPADGVPIHRRVGVDWTAR
jgi:hypothetical protein